MTILDREPRPSLARIITSQIEQNGLLTEFGGIDIEPLQAIISRGYASDQLDFVEKYIRASTNIEDTVWERALFALSHTERWLHDKEIGILNARRPNRFQESNLKHCGGILQEADSFFIALPDAEPLLIGETDKDRQDFLLSALIHDIQEALTGDAPSFGEERENYTGQLIKRAEPWVFKGMVKKWIKNPELQNLLILLSKELHAKQTPRAIGLRFFDKLQGTKTAFEEFYSFLDPSEHSQEPFNAHINASLSLIFTSGKQLSSILEPSLQEQFFQYFDNQILDNFRNAGFEEHVTKQEHEQFFPNKPHTIISFS
ncbi:MAG TPA: hypothetical protein VLF89_06505 [Candidatus Saccharimonadales bacterium]|nr:hypothetical protein [Candidatus Saccharimonadales bacterium]